MENVKAKLTEVKESTRQFLGKRLEFSGGEWILVGAVLFMAGMMTGMLIAPITRGIQVSLFSNNGNNSGSNNGNNSNGNQATLVNEDKEEDKNKKDNSKKKDGGKKERE